MHSKDQQLTECARDVCNLVNIGSHVKLDGVPAANLDVKLSMISEMSCIRGRIIGL